MVNLDSNQQIRHYQFNECYMATYNQAERSPRRLCTLYLHSFDIKLVTCQHTDNLYYPLLPSGSQITWGTVSLWTWLYMGHYNFRCCASVFAISGCERINCMNQSNCRSFWILLSDWLYSQCSCNKLQNYFQLQSVYYKCLNTSPFLNASRSKAATTRDRCLTHRRVCPHPTKNIGITKIRSTSSLKRRSNTRTVAPLFAVAVCVEFYVFMSQHKIQRISCPQVKLCNCYDIGFCEDAVAGKLNAVSASL